MLGQPSPGAGFYAESVNDQGQVLGVSYGLSGNGGRGALELWQDGTFTDLSDLLVGTNVYSFYDRDVINDTLGLSVTPLDAFLCEARFNDATNS